MITVPHVVEFAALGRGGTSARSSGHASIGVGGSGHMARLAAAIVAQGERRAGALPSIAQCRPAEYSP
eukprot:COSAG01_NODE_18384_length_1079_cov_1.550000_1_plen_67_part_01